MLSILKSIDNYFCEIEGKTQHKTLNGVSEQSKPDLTKTDKTNNDLTEIDKTIEQLIANAEPFRKLDLSKEAYGKEFEEGYIKTPIGKVKVDQAQIYKLVNKARVKFFGLIKPTLENPLIIVKSKDEQGKVREAFIKTFIDGNTIFFVSFVKTEEDLIQVSAHQRKESKIRKMLSEGSITYSPNSITALSGLPNLPEPTYTTLLIGLRLTSVTKDKQKTSQSQVKNTQPKALGEASQELGVVNKNLSEIDKTLPEVNAAFNTNLKEFEANGYKLKNRNDYFSCGYPTTNLLESGLNEKHEIIITQSVISKAIGLKKEKQDEAHSLTVDELIDFPNKLHNPVIVINGKTSDSRLAFIEILTPKRKVLAAIHFDFKGYRRVFTSIASIYSKESSAVGLLLRQAEAKNEIWHVDPKKIKDWLSETGQLQLLPRIKANLSGTNIEQKESKAKTLPSKKQTLGSILYNLFVSKEYKDQGLEGWRDDKEKFKIALVNDIKTFLFTKWEKPWVPGLIFDAKNNVISGFRNISGRNYNNQSNVISLAKNRGQSPYFITLSKLEQLGGKILDKKKVLSIISYIPIFKEKVKLGDATPVVKPDFMLPKFHSVINVDYVDGIKKPTYKTVEFEELELNEYVENFLSELKRRKRIPTLHHDEADRCYYISNPPAYTKDEIHLVEIKQFKGINEYYSTLFHEITHSTKNPKRLGRGKDNKKLDYANEELVAEMGAMIICEELGLEYKRQNSLSYLNGWLKKAKGTDIDSALIEAYAYACDAADYLLNDIELEKLVPKTLAKRAGEQENKEAPLLIARKEAMKLIGSKGIQELRGKWKIDWNNETSIREAIQTLIEAEAEAKNILSTLSGVQTQILSVNNLYPNGVNLKDLKNKYNAFKNEVILNHDKKIDILFKSIGANKSINGRKDKNGKVIPIDSIIATAISQLPYLLEYGTFRAFGKADKPVHRKVKGVRFWNFTSKLKIDGAMYRFVIPVLETENTSIFQYSIEYADIRKILANKKSAVGLKAKINQG